MSSPNEIQPLTGDITEPVVAVTPVEPVAVPEQRYEYQPTDEDGRPVGGKQVIVYKTQDELIDKMRDNSIQLIRKLREQTRNNRLGISTPDTIDDTAQRFKSPTEFKPKTLTKEDRVRL